MQKRRSLRILGTRGLPARYGGFETFAEHLAIYLRDRDWQVTVDNQVESSGPLAFDTNGPRERLWLS
jgi:hypothetical protein